MQSAYASFTLVIIRIVNHRNELRSQTDNFSAAWKRCIKLIMTLKILEKNFMAKINFPKLELCPLDSETMVKKDKGK